MQIGDVNIVESLLQSEQKIYALERVLEKALNGTIKPDDYQKAMDEGLKMLKKKYPQTVK
jgi:hypothetical protein